MKLILAMVLSCSFLMFEAGRLVGVVDIVNAQETHQKQKADRGGLQVKVTTHTAALTWSDPNTPTTGDTFNVYRLTGACPAVPPTTAPDGFTKINTAAIASLTYTDSGMAPGAFCYFVTANNTANAPNTESSPSNLVPAVIPSPTAPKPPVLNNPTVS